MNGFKPYDTFTRPTGVVHEAADRVLSVGAGLLNIQPWLVIPPYAKTMMENNPGMPMGFTDRPPHKHGMLLGYAVLTPHGIVSAFENPFGSDSPVDGTGLVVVLPPQISQLIKYTGTLTTDQALFLFGYLYEHGRGELRLSPDISDHLKNNTPFTGQS